MINGARTRMSRKPAALARELLRNFPKGKGKSKRRRRRKGAGSEAGAETVATVDALVTTEETTPAEEKPRRTRRRKVIAADPDAGAAERVARLERGQERRQPGRPPRVVVPLEREEELHEKGRAVLAPPRDGPQRGRPEPRALG